MPVTYLTFRLFIFCRLTPFNVRWPFKLLCWSSSLRCVFFYLLNVASFLNCVLIFSSYLCWLGWCSYHAAGHSISWLLQNPPFYGFRWILWTKLFLRTTGHLLIFYINRIPFYSAIRKEKAPIMWHVYPSRKLGSLLITQGHSGCHVITYSWERSVDVNWPVNYSVMIPWESTDYVTGVVGTYGFKATLQPSKPSVVLLKDQLILHTTPS